MHLTLNGQIFIVIDETIPSKLSSFEISMNSAVGVEVR